MVLPPPLTLGTTRRGYHVGFPLAKVRFLDDYNMYDLKIQIKVVIKIDKF